MGQWRVPAKVLLPAEPDRSPSTFEFNGRLTNGDQVLAYVAARSGHTSPSATPFTRFTAIVFRFDSDGALLMVDFATTAHGGDYLEKDAERSRAKAQELLVGMMKRVRAEGWVSADILVRPFHVQVDGLRTGLVYMTEGEDEGEESDDNPESLRLIPFDKIFRPPWTNGEYDT